MATVITPATVQARYPGLMDYSNSESQAVLTLAIEDADIDVDEDRWGVDYSRAMCALAAHFTTERLPKGEQGAGVGAFAVSAISADGVSASYAVPSDIPHELAHYYATTYGKTYMDLMRRRFSGPQIVQS